jgi:hypothetical protein
VQVKFPITAFVNRNGLEWQFAYANLNNDETARPSDSRRIEVTFCRKHGIPTLEDALE